MNDDFEQEKIEQMLLKYRPVKLPADLERKIFEPQKTHRPRFSRIISAAAAMLMIAVLGLWLVNHLQKRSQYNLQQQIMQVTAEIFSAGESAQLLALADILNQDPANNEQAGRIYDDILSNYPGSKPAKTINEREKNN